MIDLMQANSINRLRVNWASFRAQVLKAALSAKTIKDAYSAIGGEWSSSPRQLRWLDFPREGTSQEGLGHGEFSRHRRAANRDLGEVL
jgi:hypothetical protein